ncbi:MAG: hypothetical protein N3A61_10230 [Ignavibacteria bacterium]|nr:hypothetical protein [Ignavibacteria bacterium]
MRAKFLFLFLLSTIVFFNDCKEKKSVSDETKIADLISELSKNNLSISNVFDYPIWAIKDCVEGKSILIDSANVVILNFVSAEQARKYALSYAGVETSNKTFSIGKFVIRSEESIEIGEKIKSALKEF